ncbi:hypothetical protein [Coleofasciculus sp. E2-BRE-01]|uniref:hypothetical protein n=1 Tax=unclassified Coleofasciculus TaxID=2692782 RepID=UPI0032F70145
MISDNCDAKPALVLLFESKNYLPVFIQGCLTGHDMTQQPLLRVRYPSCRVRSYQ